MRDRSCCRAFLFLECRASVGPSGPRNFKESARKGLLHSSARASSDVDTSSVSKTTSVYAREKEPIW